MKIASSIALIAGLSLLAGCATTVPMESASLDATAKTFAPVPDKSVIYIYRDSGMGDAISMPLLVDNHLIGETAPNVYFRVVVAPGNHELWAKASYDAHLSMATEAGQVYYVKQRALPGIFYAGAGLKQETADDARDDMKDCKLAKGNELPQQ